MEYDESGVEMGEEGPWGTLIGEALAEVFARLTFEERLRTVPLVCKGWRNASYDPACWRKVDMEPWFQGRSEEDYYWEFECEEKMEFLVKKVVDRACGQIRELRTMFCTNESVDYIAQRCPLLTVLSIPNSFHVTDSSACKVAENCPRLQHLDLSDCYHLSIKALEAFGTNCPSLVGLNRNMMKCLDFEGIVVPSGDDEAVIVARHMMNLKSLELKKSTLTDLGLSHIAKGCTRLESLNLACCAEVSPTAVENVTTLSSNLQQFVKPINARMHVNQKFLWVLFD